MRPAASAAAPARSQRIAGSKSVRNVLRDDSPWFDYGGAVYPTAEEVVPLALAHELLRMRSALRLWFAIVALLLLFALVPGPVPT